MLIGRRPAPPFLWLQWLCFTLMLVAGNSYALTCTSNAGGNWATAATWTGCPGPAAGDTVVINGGTVILNTSPPTIASLTLNGGALTIGSSNAARTLSVSGNITVANGAAVNVANNTVTHILNVGGNLTNNGTFDLLRDPNSLCTINFNGATTQTVSGNGALTEFSNATANSNLTINMPGATLTQTGTLSVAGNLAVLAGTITAANSLSVTGTTAISGTLTQIATTGTTTFTGDVTVNSGGLLSETVAESIAFGGNLTIAAGGTVTEFGAATMSFAGSLQNDGTYTASTGAHTFTGSAKSFSGASPMAIPSVSISGTYQNNGTLTVATTLAGGGTLTNGSTGILNIGATTVTPTLVATANGNTVNYNRAGAQTVKATSYYNLSLGGSGAKTLTGVSTVGGNLSLSGTATAATATAMTIGGNVDVGGGTQFTVAGFNIAVTGTTSVTGTLTHGSATGTKTYTGSVTINNGGTWSETAAPAITFGGDLQNNGTLTASTGLHTFTGSTRTFSGTNAIAIPNTTINGTYQNNGALAVATALSGAGTLTNGAAGTLNIGGASAISNFSASAPGNTVIYSGSAQTIKAATYHHLTLAGTGTSPLAGAATVGGALTLTTGILAVGANTLTLDGPAIAGAGAAINLATTSSSNLVFNGSFAGVSLPGSVTALNNLTVNNSNGIAMGGTSVTTVLSGILALGANQVTTGSNILAMSGDCSANGGNGSLTRTSGYVIGNLRLGKH